MRILIVIDLKRQQLLGTVMPVSNEAFSALGFGCLCKPAEDQRRN